MTFETEFELSLEDFKEIAQNHLYRRSARQIWNILQVILGTVIGICAILMAIAGGTNWAIFFGFVCLVVFGVLILQPMLAVRSLQNTPFYQGKVRVRADDSAHDLYTGQAIPTPNGQVTFDFSKQRTCLCFMSRRS